MSERNPGPTFQIPDLELEPAPSKRAAPAATAPAPAAVPGGPTKGRELDIEAGPGITLSTGTHGSAAPSFGLELSGDAFDDGSDFELIQTGSKVELAGAVTQSSAAKRVEAAGWPSGRTVSAEQLPVDAVEVALVADYGEAPKSALATPLYAYRVYSRRGPLRRALVEHNLALQQAEAQRDEALAQLATELRPTLEASDAFRRLLEPIREVERLAGDRSAALSEADAGYREQMARFDSELATLEGALAQASALCAERQSLADASDNELRRAEAKLQRVQIEIRGVLDVARQAVGPAGGDMPAAQAAQLAELQARAAALEPEVAALRATNASVHASLEQALSEQRRREANRQKLLRQKATAGGTLEKQLSARAAGVSEAEQQRRSGLADVARGVLASRGSVPVPERTLSALHELDRNVMARALHLETHLRALDSYDHERVRQGVILALSALGLVVLAIALKAVL